ncbi:hypothetical protein BGZ54_004492, partial [Gamsiella multidivaricata]
DGSAVTNGENSGDDEAEEGGGSGGEGSSPRLPELMFEITSEKDSFSTARDSRSFRNLAQELAEQEPMLRKVTGLALRSMYTRLIKSYEELDKILALGTGSRFQPTLLSDLAKQLYDLHREFTVVKKHRSMRWLITEGEPKSRNIDAIVNCMLPLSAKIEGKRNDTPDQAESATASSKQPPRINKEAYTESTAFTGEVRHGLMGTFEISKRKFTEIDQQYNGLSNEMRQLKELVTLHPTDNTNAILSQVQIVGEQVQIVAQSVESLAAEVRMLTGNFRS